MSKEHSDFFVRVTLSPDQARALVVALGFYSRICCGQFDEFLHLFSNMKHDRGTIDSLLAHIRSFCLPELDPRVIGYGIAECPNEGARISWDILQVVRKAEIEAREPDGPRSLVSYNDSLFVSKSVPRPVAKSIGLLDRMIDD